MILAAGFGERLRPLTATTPKPLLVVGGKPLIQHHIEKLAAAGVRDLVINTTWLGGKIESFIGDGDAFGVRIAWSREGSPLETGGGIWRALPLLGTAPFLVINGDVWTDFPLPTLTTMEWSQDCDAHLVLVPNPPHHASGDFGLDARGRIANNGAEALTFSGVSVMRPELFTGYGADAEKFPLRPVLDAAIRRDRVSGEFYTGRWCDVGTVERLRALDEFLCSSRHV
jgi:MurNAc alpha-1-phosphate uridylyltransferase